MKPYFQTSHLADLLPIASPARAAIDATLAGIRRIPQWRTYHRAGGSTSP